MKYHARADKRTKGDKYALFIGRWQKWHQGHRWLIDQALERGKKVMLAIRDVELDDKNPHTAREIMARLENDLADLIDKGDVILQIIPDIESVEFGRDVGYDIIEHFPPDDLKSIKASNLHEKNPSSVTNI